MKILIPYDGSKNAEIALGVLGRRADFTREKHDALVVVSNVWLPASPEEFSYAAAARRHKTMMSGIASHAPALRALEEERVLEREARERVTSMFPLWNVRVETLPGFHLVSSEILEKAERSETDVIVIGTRNVFGAAAYSAGALRVAKEAGCNVFFARETDFGGSGEPNEKLPDRIIVVLAGTSADVEIVQTAARRNWARNSEARIISIGANSSPNREARATETLRAAGLNVSMMKPESDSPAALTRAVTDWNPDCIFAGGEVSVTRGRRNFSSETTEILKRMGCSVELVRKAHGKTKAMRTAA